MKVVFFLLGSIVLLYWVKVLWSHSRLSGNSEYFFTLLSIKLVAGMVVGLVYQFYYEAGDTLGFHEGAARLSNQFFSDVSLYLESLAVEGRFTYFHEPRSDFFIRLLSIIYLFTFGNYWLATAFLSIISFTVIWSFITRFCIALGLEFRLVALSFLVFPSVVFWTSGVMKETLSFGLQCLIVWSSIPLIEGKKLRSTEILIGLFSFWLLFQIKYYHAAVLFFVLAPTILYITLLAKLESIAVRSFILISLGVAILLGLGQVHYNLNITRISEVIVTNHHRYLQISSPDKVFILEDFDNSLRGYLTNLPEAVFSGFFRPLPWEIYNLPSFLMSIENLILLILLLFSLKYWNSFLDPGFAKFLPLIVFVLLMATLIAYSTPNFGTLSRYKAVYMPFFITLILCRLPLFHRKSVHSSE